MPNPTDDTFHPADRKEWRQWLIEHHHIKLSVWVIFNKAKSGKRSLTWSESVDEALCFGWIDSKALTLDEHRYKQFFSRRKPKSVWSRINKEKIDRLIADGLMTEAGLRSIEIAKENGSWTSLDEAENLIIPKDLEKAFKQHKGSKTFFTGLSKSVRKGMLTWIAMAKLPETRQRRINEVAELGAKGVRPKQFG